MSPRTQEAYVMAVYYLAKHYHRSPDQLSNEELKNYLYYLATERKLSASTLNQRVSAFRFLYEVALHRRIEEVRESMPRVYRAIRRPQVFSVEELEDLFGRGCTYPKARAFLMTVYGAGVPFLVC
jgi:integrase/recombinase XerD